METEKRKIEKRVVGVGLLTPPLCSPAAPTAA